MRNTPYNILNIRTFQMADGHKGRPCKGTVRLRGLNYLLLSLVLLLVGCSDKLLDRASADG